MQGLGLGLSDLRSRKKGKQKAVSSKESHVSEAVEKLAQQTRETVRGLESVAGPPGGDLGSDEMVEEFVKQFEQFASAQV